MERLTDAFTVITPTRRPRVFIVLSVLLTYGRHARLPTCRNGEGIRWPANRICNKMNESRRCRRRSCIGPRIQLVYCCNQDYGQTRQDYGTTAVFPPSHTTTPLTLNPVCPPLAHPHFHVDETRTVPKQLKAEAAAKKKAEKEAAKASAAAAAPPASAAASARSKAKAGAADEEELDPTQYFANRSRCACDSTPM